MEKTKKENKHALFYQLLKDLPGYDIRYRDVIKEGIIYEHSGGKTTSLSEMWNKYPAQYSDMIEAMKRNRQDRANHYQDESDKWRKRVIAVIAQMVDKAGHNFDNNAKKLDYIKRLACRAGNCSEFNRIPLSRLQGLYNYFLDRNKLNRYPDPSVEFNRGRD